MNTIQKNIDEFARHFKKDPVLSLVGIMTARNVESAYELSELFDSDAQLKKHLEVKDYDRWISFYENRDVFLDHLIRIIWKTKKNQNEIKGLIKQYDALIEQYKTKPPLLIQESIQHWVKSTKGKQWIEKNKSKIETIIKYLCYLALAPDDEKVSFTDEEDQIINLLISNDIVGFFSFAIVPCFFKYQQMPWEVYSKAVQGDFSAFEQLLNLDSAVLHSPKILKLFNSIRDKKDFRAEIIGKAISTHFEYQTKKHVKERFAAFISLCKRSKPINSAQIAKMFHFAKKIQTENPNAIDQDITTAETFSKSVQRNKKSLKKILPNYPDKLP